MHKKDAIREAQVHFLVCESRLQAPFFLTPRRFAPPSTERATTYRPKGEGVGKRLFIKIKIKKIAPTRARTPCWWVVGVPFYHADHSDM